MRGELCKNRTRFGFYVMPRSAVSLFGERSSAMPQTPNANSLRLHREGKSVEPLISRTTFIHFLRFSAAGVVAAAHLRDVMFADYKAVLVRPVWFTGLAGITGFAGDAVMIFFVISGWLVGGSLLNRRDSLNPYKDYVVARVSRLWSVLVPLFIIQAVCHFPGLFDVYGTYGAVTVVGNLIGLQTVYFDTYAGNFPLWSLANETAYYAAFVGLVAAFDARLSKFKRIACVVGVLSYGAILTYQIDVYFSVWLIGAMATRLRLKSSKKNIVLFASLFMFLIVFKRYNNMVNDIIFDVASSVPLALLLNSIPDSKGAKFERLLAHLAGFSFSLYVIHMPLISLFNFQSSNLMDMSVRHFDDFCFRLVLLIVLAFIYGKIFEDRYPIIRRWMSKRLTTPIARTA